MEEEQRKIDVKEHSSLLQEKPLNVINGRRKKYGVHNGLV